MIDLQKFVKFAADKKANVDPAMLGGVDPNAALSGPPVGGGGGILSPDIISQLQQQLQNNVQTKPAKIDDNTYKLVVLNILLKIAEALGVDIGARTVLPALGIPPGAVAESGAGGMPPEMMGAGGMPPEMMGGAGMPAKVGSALPMRGRAYPLPKQNKTATDLLMAAARRLQN